ncbi:hypothetical protein BDB01DRAFT_526860 [Pilobolus umbonatus]|nr:hypothetical protein BDB01DRAFT_526860 [Pilobolus umbonatus]
MRLTDGKRSEQRAYYRYRLHLPSTEYSTIFRAKRPFQQFLVDMWAVCDQAKLD